MEFECAYLVIAIPFILGFLYAIVLNVQELEIPFLKESLLFENFAFSLFIGGFVFCVDVVGTVRMFSDTDINPVYDILFILSSQRFCLVHHLLFINLLNHQKPNSSNRKLILYLPQPSRAFFCQLPITTHPYNQVITWLYKIHNKIMRCFLIFAGENQDIETS